MFTNGKLWIRCWARCSAELCKFSSHNSTKYITSVCLSGNNEGTESKIEQYLSSR